MQNYGEVFTLPWVVEVLLDLTGYTEESDLGSKRLVEPSCGSGAFLGLIVQRLVKSAQACDRDLSSLGDAIRAYDLQSEHVQASRQLCRGLLAEAGASAPVAHALSETWVRHADFLLADLDDYAPNVVVGNPPYIRYDDLPDQLAARYRRTWATMRGRGDIYVGFIERSLRLLAPDGKVGFICADRWMRNQYGADLRAFVASGYAVEHVWTMHDVEAFERSVSAYPAITVLGNHVQGSAVVADTTGEFTDASAKELVEATSLKDFQEFSGNGVKAHRLDSWFDGGELWPTGTPARLALIEHLQHFEPLHSEDTQTKVSIGIATGADKVYIVKDPSLVEEDRALPLAMRRDLMTGEFKWQGNYLINPWDDDGNLVDLADYPRMHDYLSRHPVLLDRFVAKKDPQKWHRTIDKVHSALIRKPKLLLQDMKTTIHPVLERGDHYPHHNLYYIVSDQWDMEVLGGILLSRIAQAFIEAYCVRMRGGTLRFQAQYLKRIRVPLPDQIDPDTQDELRSAFQNRDVEAATRAAAYAYDIDLRNYDIELQNDALITIEDDDESSKLTPTHDDYDTAVKAFWTGRSLQAQKQRDSGKLDAGTRGSVTGGQHLLPLQEVIAREFAPLNAIDGVEVRYQGSLSIPGYLRRTKDWDIVVKYNDILVAAIELKSQVGSVGNNFNNRTEEMIGNAVDLRLAYDEGLLGAHRIQPWLGIFFVFEQLTDAPPIVRDKGATLYRPDQAFDNSSYMKRYQLLLQRLVDKNFYDAACLVSTRRDEGIYDEPVCEVSVKSFSTAIANRVAEIQEYASRQAPEERQF
ncbi:hypothetical protein GCM10011609_49090 [Lentzea pudingi]|uniref:site-specific DNA-methyltransferase (adenine-specific) n=1 Tax=Lentzea pudingi TaxID=1789439 RepID=A0ABQ2IDA6_9PSEU|nr:PaeR7I family type II restriction endonuclease [Lentzea pudingi]GGN04083.1 hypothetical protein GCM10011609_49090 [Lentzea pudingi]